MESVMDDGILVAFEGIDGAGKTTQMARLRESLHRAGFHVTSTKEPTQGPYGQRIRASARTGRLAASEELELFLLDREEHAREVLRPALERGEVVLVDRYYFSSMAYQGARGLDVDVIRRRSEAIAPQPDLLVVLDVAPEIGLARVRGRGDVPDAFEELEALRASRGIFGALEDPFLLRLDGNRSVDAVAADIRHGLYLGPLRHRLCEKDPTCTGQCHLLGRRHCRWAALEGFEPSVPMSADLLALARSDLPVAEKLRRAIEIATLAQQ